MIKIIYGGKGTGKTKRIIESVNSSLTSRKGDVIFLAATSRYRTEINASIRFIDTNDVGIQTKTGLIGFVKGLLSGNYDIEAIYIDGMYKMMNVALDDADVAEFMLALESLATNVEFILTANCDKEELPTFLAKYIED